MNYFFEEKQDRFKHKSPAHKFQPAYRGKSGMGASHVRLQEEGGIWRNETAGRRHQLGPLHTLICF
jgi:hypothetical protein